MSYMCRVVGSYFLPEGRCFSFFDRSITFQFLFQKIVERFLLFLYFSCVGFGRNKFSYFSAGFFLFSPKGSVAGCDSSLGSFCYFITCIPVQFMTLQSSYYYYDCNNRLCISKINFILFNKIADVQRD